MVSVARAREILRWEGIKGLLRRGLRKVLHPIIRVRRLLFFEMDLTKPFPKIEARVPLEMRVATAEDLDTFGEALTELGMDIAKARRQLDRGDLLTLALSRGTLTNAGWITFSSPFVDEIGVILELRPGESSDYQAVTHPDWRGLRIQPAASLFRNECQRARGYTRHIAWVWADNISNVKPQAARGRRHTKTVWSIWILGMRRPLLLGVTQEGSPSLVWPTTSERP
jgi:hypothetical protein